MKVVFRIISITKILKWLFLLVGVFGPILAISYTKWFSLVFILCVLIEPGSIQGLYQIFGIFYIYISHKFNLPSKENYIYKVNYILPFLERWTVVNGGVGKELSHSWGIPTQR